MTNYVPTRRLSDLGRVIGDGGHGLRGVYNSGWVKRGCRGIIGSNRKCARETVAQLLDDWASGRLAGPALNKEAVLAAVRARQPDALTLGDWLAIHRHERYAGRQQGRPRVKLTEGPRLPQANRMPQWMASVGRYWCSDVVTVRFRQQNTT